MGLADECVCALCLCLPLHTARRRSLDQKKSTTHARTPTWSPQKTDSRPLRMGAYTPVCFSTASKIVMGSRSPPTVSVAGSFTPGLLLFSAPGRGARLRMCVACRVDGWYDDLLC